MTTKIRPELSKRNKYYISRHRYYELKHFCLQYKSWKNIVNEYNLDPSSYNFNSIKSSDIPDKTSKDAMVIFHLKLNIEIIESCAKNSDAVLYEYILNAVTNGRSYTYLKTVCDIPCGKDAYYFVYRKFFFLLSEARG